MFDLKAHVRQRGVDLGVHTVWFDEDKVVATFPLWSLTGNMCGYQSYRPLANKNKRNDEYGRYYKFDSYNEHHPRKKQSKTVPLWGLESWDFTPNLLFVTEGIFDAARLTQKRVSSVAVMANDPNSSVKNWLWIVSKTRRVVAVTDPGAAGQRLRRATPEFHVVDVPGDADADLGAAPDWYVEKLVTEYDRWKYV